MKYNTRCTAITVVPEDEKIFSEMATEVSIEDEGGGEFIEITQTHSECNTIRIDPKEWPAIRSAVNRLMKGIK